MLQKDDVRFVILLKSRTHIEGVMREFLFLFPWRRNKTRKSWTEPILDCDFFTLFLQRCHDREPLLFKAKDLKQKVHQRDLYMQWHTSATALEPSALSISDWAVRFFVLRAPDTVVSAGFERFTALN